MLLLMLVQVFVRGASMIKSNMRLHVRLRFWVGLASAYVLFMGFVHLLQVPLRSNALHSHYDLSGEGVFAKHRAAVKKEAEKYAQAALKAPAADMETAQQISLLKETFKKADSSVDGLLDLAELSSWISTKIKEHLTLALKENFFMFTAIDQDPRNGMVSWDEFHHYFLKQHGYDDKYIQEHKKNHKGMPRELKEAIMRDKAAWSEAARDNPEHLTIDEFLAFRHPESSHATILSIVEETIGRLDVDEDNKLSEDEFSDPDMNEVPDDMTLEQYKNERLKEFRIADEDSNGKVDRRELLRYIDPRNIHHAEKEAVNLLSAADTNQDGVLTLVEVLAQREMFMRSKMVDAAKSFHDEF
ncbi:45 kDa calcium-binding protein-like [Homarus americanus]|uniref:45 kDa calcium-binding protein-like n=1 Tax=Homarus americanus TaxID=6706 RepID=UPI001C452B01|nr:45 kDa calcium-binding protein-like [Homarus americanus]XP_042208652.1 45 kDa calcium-binding protein-like [Homarus americanus]